MYVDRSAGVSRVQVERLLGEASVVVQRTARLFPWGTSSFCLLAIVELTLALAVVTALVQAVGIGFALLVPLVLVSRFILSESIALDENEISLPGGSRNPQGVPCPCEYR
jgi:hypothetical protein